MDMKKLTALAREKFGTFCRVCPVCDGRACKGEIPGAGGEGTGRSFQNNLLALQAVQLKQRVIHNVTNPDTSCKIFGLNLKMPILGAPIGGIAFNWNNFLPENEYAATIVTGCKQAGCIGMTGDGKDPNIYKFGLEAIAKDQGYGIATIKPRPNEQIIQLAQQAIDCGTSAIAIDIDAAALINMTVSGQPVSGKTIDQLRELKANISVPLIIKGIMTPEDALACVQAGVDGIVVSNHGGRVLDDTPGTAAVLPAIKQAVGDNLTILVDGGIRNGTDVLKMLALGADAVMLGRPILFSAAGGLAGVNFLLNKFQNELVASMIMTGCQNLDAVQADIIYRP